MTLFGTTFLGTISRGVTSSSSLSLFDSDELSRALAFLAAISTTPDRSILGGGASSSELDSELD